MAPHDPQTAETPSAHPVRPRGGRPSRDDAERLRDDVLDAATILLLTQGYGATSIEAVAARARVSKRTFYHRFKDKPALMCAVVTRLIDRLRPPAGAPLIEGGDLESILLHLARLILRAALLPDMLALHRLIVAESQRFPDLAAAVAMAGGRQEAVKMIGALLQHHRGDASLGRESAEFAAQQFLQMIVSLPQLRALGMGEPMAPDELEAWARQSVALFLEGVGGVQRAALKTVAGAPGSAV